MYQLTEMRCVEAISWPWDVITFLLLSQYHHVVTGSNTRLQNELFDSNIHSSGCEI